MKNNYRFIQYILVFSLLSFPTKAQDTTKKTIEITSSFKPVLRNAEKMDIQATPPPPDTILPKFQYLIPSQHLIPQLTPVSLKPLAVSMDTIGKGLTQRFVKAGFGNLSTPYLLARLSIPSNNNLFNFSAEHISSSGKMVNQDYGETDIGGQIRKTIQNQFLLDVSAAFSQDKYYLFGYDINKFTYNRTQLRQFFYSGEAGVSFQNIIPSKLGVTYKPRINLAFFSDNNQNREENISIHTPIEKYLGKSFGLQLAMDANITRFSRNKSTSIQNNLFQVPVALTLRTPNLQFKAGLIPSWDNHSFRLLPDLKFNIPVSGHKWVLEGGWLNHFNKGDYRQLASQNPYLSIPTELRNERIVDRYLGLKGTLSKHLNYSATVGYVEFHNKPLFVNDTMSGKQFDIVFEDLLTAFQVQAEIGFIKAEHLSASARINWLSFAKQNTDISPWGLLPLEISGRLRWHLMKDLTITSDLFLWQGPLFIYRNTKQSGRANGAIDLNTGVEFRLTKHISVWSQFNNIFNAAYQRWNQYQNYGFNMLIGGIFRFDP